MTAKLRDRPPWFALAASPVAWFVYEQGLGTVVRLACASDAFVGVIWGVLAAAVCVAGGVFGLRAAANGPAEITARATQFIGMVAVGEAAAMGLAIIYQMLATVIVPACAR
ncbi:MAG: hypothetical protein JO111_11660 [Caulobacteraceae bacterium]|nr:hypothetical protein [Caulobacteraceae bacterium]